MARAGGSLRVAPLLLSIAALGGCTTVPRAVVRPAAVAAIRAARSAQNRAIVAGDLDRIASFWTDDVLMRRGLGPAVVGRAAYRQLFADDRPPALIYVRRPTAIEVGERWPLAFETGEWSGHLGGPQAPALISGRYSAQWVERDGAWLIRAEVFVALHCEGAGCRWSATP